MTTPDLTALRALADRVRQAEGPDRELDGEIAILFLDDDRWRSTGYGFLVDTVGNRCRPPFYTASLNAAVELVGRMLPGWWRSCGVGQDGPICRLLNPATPQLPVIGRAATEPLAIIAAVLAAKIAEAERAAPLAEREAAEGRG